MGEGDILPSGALLPAAGTRNIAPRVILFPTALPPPTIPEGWIALAQLPRQAGAAAVFGDGSHATTRLCAAAVDLHCRLHQPRAVLDVGTGTGILARIARARGADVVVATDIDSAALVSARANAALDGQTAAIHFCADAPDRWGPRFDLVVANILEAPLVRLLPAMMVALKPGGTLLISGFTRPQIPALRVPYEAAGLQCRGTFNLNEWALLQFVA